MAKKELNLRSRKRRKTNMTIVIETTNYEDAIKAKDAVKELARNMNKRIEDKVSFALYIDINGRQDFLSTSDKEEINSMEINFEKEVLKINGEEIKNKAIVVGLPGPDGWEKRKVFNPELADREQGVLEKILLHVDGREVANAVLKENRDIRKKENRWRRK